MKYLLFGAKTKNQDGQLVGVIEAKSIAEANKIGKSLNAPCVYAATSTEISFQITMGTLPKGFDLSKQKILN